LSAEALALSFTNTIKLALACALAGSRRIFKPQELKRARRQPLLRGGSLAIVWSRVLMMSSHAGGGEK
jgi:hypothetical protein